MLRQSSAASSSSVKPLLPPTAQHPKLQHTAAMNPGTNRIGNGNWSGHRHHLWCACGPMSSGGAADIAGQTPTNTQHAHTPPKHSVSPDHRFLLLVGLTYANQAGPQDTTELLTGLLRRALACQACRHPTQHMHPVYGVLPGSQEANGCISRWSSRKPHTHKACTKNQTDVAMLLYAPHR